MKKISEIPDNIITFISIKMLVVFFIQHFPEQTGILNILEGIKSYLKQNKIKSQSIGRLLKQNIITQSINTYEHNKLIDNNFVISFFKNENQYALTDKQIAFISHMLHATVNNILLARVLYMSIIHSIYPKKYPNDSYKLLGTVFYIARSHMSNKINNKMLKHVFNWFNNLGSPWKSNFSRGLNIERECFNNELTQVEKYKILQDRFKVK